MFCLLSRKEQGVDYKIHSSELHKIYYGINGMWFSGPTGAQSQSKRVQNRNLLLQNNSKTHKDGSGWKLEHLLVLWIPKM